LRKKDERRLKTKCQINISETKIKLTEYATKFEILIQNRRNHDSDGKDR